MLLLALFLSLLFNFVYGDQVEELSFELEAIFLTLSALYGNTELFVLLKNTNTNYFASLLMVAWFLIIFLVYYAYIYAKVNQQFTAMQTKHSETQKKVPPFDFTPSLFIRVAERWGTIKTVFKWAFCHKKYQKGLFKIREEKREFAIEKKIEGNIGFDIDISDPKFDMFNSMIQDLCKESN